MYGEDRETTLCGALINVFGNVAERGEVPCQRARLLVSLNFTSWNHIGEWLRQVDGLRHVG